MSRHLVFSFAVSIGATACGGGADVSTTDTGPLPVDAEAADGGPTGDAGGADARMPELDGGLSELDSGSTETDGGSPDFDAGGGEVDGGGADGGVDAGGADAGVDGGPADGGVGGAPTCVITAPLAGTVQDFDDDFLFIASASDPEDGALAGASIVWRSDRIVAPLGSGVSITTLLVPGMHAVTCTATDSNGNVGTATVRVTSRSPVAVINHPGDGERRSAVSSIPFVGVGRDFEDGSLPASALVWTSNLDGMIGTGLSFNRMLTAGTNVVTLTVTDSGGNTGTDTITLTITP